MVPSLAAWFAETPSPSPEPVRYIDPATIGPGLIGFILFVFLGVATFVLWRSMNRQLKKIDFDEGDGDTGADAADAEVDLTDGETDQADNEAK